MYQPSESAPLPLVHIMFGEPDDDCEICRAHGLKKEDGAASGFRIVAEITRHSAMECSCPMCSMLSTKGWGGL